MNNDFENDEGGGPSPQKGNKRYQNGRADQEDMTSPAQVQLEINEVHEDVAP